MKRIDFMEEFLIQDGDIQLRGWIKWDEKDGWWYGVSKGKVSTCGKAPTKQQAKAAIKTYAYLMQDVSGAEYKIERIDVC